MLGMDCHANGLLEGPESIYNGSGAKQYLNHSKVFTKKSSKKQFLDLYNNVQLIDNMPPALSGANNHHFDVPSCHSFSNYPSSLQCTYTTKSTENFEKGECQTCGKKCSSNSTSSVDDASPFSSSSSISARSPVTLSRTNTLPRKYMLSRSFSVPSQSLNSTPTSKRLTFFGKTTLKLASPSISPMPLNDSKTPSPARFLSMYQAVRKGVSEHISVNTAELNVLQVRKQRTESLNAAQSYETDKHITHLERLIKRLQYHQTQLDEKHEEYVLQQRYQEGASKLKSALSSSRVSSRSSLLGIKHDLSRCMETLCSLEHDLSSLLGRFRLQMKGLLGFARLRAGDHYEVVVRHGAQKWRLRGSVKSSGDQTWDQSEHTLQPLLSDLIHIKVMEVKLLGMLTLVGSATVETNNLFSMESQDLLLDLNDTGTLKLSLSVTWRPFEDYEYPVGVPISGTFSSSTSSRLRTRSVAERPPPRLTRPRSRLSVALTRPMSAVFSSPSANCNNSNNVDYLDVLSSFSSSCSCAGDFMRRARRPSNSESLPQIAPTTRSEEEAFVEAVLTPVKLPSNCEEDLQDSDEIQRLSKMPTANELEVGRRLVAKATEVNLLMDDYRGAHEEIQRLEVMLLSLRDRLKISKDNKYIVDGFSVSSADGSISSNPLIDAKDETADPFSTSGRLICDEALLSHLEVVQHLLEDVGVFGPLKVREVLALNNLKKQSLIFQRLLDIAVQDKEPVLEELEEFTGKQTVLELWKSCCDGRTSFTVTGRTLRRELTSQYSQQVRDKHPDVADELFTELVRRILNRSNLHDPDTSTVTIFQVSEYVNTAADSIHEDLGKIVDKVALEMFITSTLRSGSSELALVAIKRMSSLLALRLSNLRALSHLLLETDCTVRTAAAAHIKHISTEESLREKAVVHYAGLLESSATRDRQCAVIALGFLSATECIEQLAYLCHGDPEADVREASSNVLLSFGEEGREARDLAQSTLLAQSRSRQVSVPARVRMGTAL